MNQSIGKEGCDRAPTRWATARSQSGATEHGFYMTFPQQPFNYQIINNIELRERSGHELDMRRATKSATVFAIVCQ